MVTPDSSEGQAIPKLDTSGNEITEYINEPPLSFKNIVENSKSSHVAVTSANDILRTSAQQSNMFRRALGEFEVAADGGGGPGVAARRDSCLLMTVIVSG